MTAADLTPDALARLEAKLVADLDMVRKVRALLEEHRIPVLGVAAPAVAAAEVSTPAKVQTPVVQVPQPPRKPYEEIFTACLKAMLPEGFNLGVLKQALRKAGVHPSDSRVKADMNRLIRQGKVVVVKTATGRIGSTYRYTVPAEAMVENLEPKPAGASADAKDAEPQPTSDAEDGE